MFRSEIIGRLGADAEIVTTGNTPFISCRAAVNDTVSKDKTITTWVSLALDATKFKNLAQHLTKGKLVYATGRQRVSGYLTKNGEAGADVRIWVDSIDFIPTGQKQTEEDNDVKISIDKLKEKKTTPITDAKVTVDDEDDLPF